MLPQLLDQEPGVAALVQISAVGQTATRRDDEAREFTEKRTETGLLQAESVQVRTRADRDADPQALQGTGRRDIGRGNTRH